MPKSSGHSLVCLYALRYCFLKHNPLITAQVINYIQQHWNTFSPAERETFLQDTLDALAMEANIANNTNMYKNFIAWLTEQITAVKE